MGIILQRSLLYPSSETARWRQKIPLEHWYVLVKSHCVNSERQYLNVNCHEKLTLKKKLRSHVALSKKPFANHSSYEEKSEEHTVFTLNYKNIKSRTPCCHTVSSVTYLLET